MKKFTTIIAFIFTVAVNAAANIIEFNGVTTAEVSDMFPVFFVPAGYVFSIWGLIYLLLGVFVAYHWVAIERDDERFNVLTPLFVLSSIANIAWIFFWHYGIVSGSLVMMIVLLLSLIAIYVYLRKSTRVAEHAIEKWTIQLPFSVYLGWITVATVANVSVYLFDLRWNGGAFLPEQWAAIMIIVAALLGVALGFRYRDVAYNLVLIWAIVGIMLKFWYVNVISYTAALVLCALACVVVWILIARKRID